MCVVSMVMDHWNDRLQPYQTWTSSTFNPQIVTKAEFDELKKEVEHLKDLLKKAKIYDEVNNQKDCELEEKITLLRNLAKVVGIDLDEILKKKE